MIIRNIDGEKLSLTKTRLRTTDSRCHKLSMRLVDFKPKGKSLVYIVSVDVNCMHAWTGVNVEGHPAGYYTYSRADGTGHIGCQEFDAKNFSKIVKAADAAKKAKKAAKKKGKR